MISLVGGDLYQWDTGRVVQVTTDAHEVHYSTKSMEFAYVLETYEEDGNRYCKIPNIILQSSGNVICYEVIQNSEGEETISQKTLKVIARNKPEDYVYTETERISLADLYDRVKTLEDTVVSYDRINNLIDTKLGVIENGTY